MMLLGVEYVPKEDYDKLVELLRTKEDFRPSGDPELDEIMKVTDPTFIEFRNTLPDRYWARYDLSAVRIGWHFGKKYKGLT